MADRCSKCKDTGLRLEPGEEMGTYCDCPIGEAFSAAWMGTGHEEEAVAATEKMRVFLLAAHRPLAETPGETSVVHLTTGSEAYCGADSWDGLLLTPRVDGMTCLACRAAYFGPAAPASRSAPGVPCASCGRPVPGVLSSSMPVICGPCSGPASRSGDPGARRAVYLPDGWDKGLHVSSCCDPRWEQEWDGEGARLTCAGCQTRVSVRLEGTTAGVISERPGRTADGRQAIDVREIRIVPQPTPSRSGDPAPTCPKCGGAAQFVILHRGGSGRRLFACNDTSCGGAVWLPASPPASGDATTPNPNEKK